MTQIIAGFGAVITIVAPPTFPTGIVLTEFADDVDPFDLPALAIADTGMGLNGDLLVWANAVPLALNIGLIPGSVSDSNMAILANANRVSKNKNSDYSSITATIVYPDASALTLSEGVITGFMPGKSVAAAGRQKSRVYNLMFAALNQGT